MIGIDDHFISWCSVRDTRKDYKTDKLALQMLVQQQWDVQVQSNGEGDQKATAGAATDPNIPAVLGPTFYNDALNSPANSANEVPSTETIPIQKP